jgi:hypothetical protein
VRTPDLSHTIVGFATNVAAVILCAGLFPDLAAMCGLATNRIITAVVGLAAQCPKNIRISVRRSRGILPAFAARSTSRLPRQGPILGCG